MEDMKELIVAGKKPSRPIPLDSIDVLHRIQSKLTVLVTVTSHVEHELDPNDQDGLRWILGEILRDVDAVIASTEGK